MIDEDQSTGHKVNASVTIGACTFELDPADEFARAFLYGYEHEPVLLGVSTALCGKSSTIWDIGANFGFYAIQLAAHAGPGVRVTAFEPGRKALDFLRRNVDKNGLADRITLADHAVGAVSKKAKFYQMANSAMSGLSDTGRSAKSDTFDVMVRTMDEVWEEQGRPPLSLVKIDVEGHECEVLAGGRNALAQSPDAVVVLELSEKNLSAARADNTRKILSEYADAGWHLLSPDSDGRLVPFNPNLAGRSAAAGDDTVIMVRASSKREKNLKAIWGKVHKKRSIYLRDNADLRPALSGISRYVTHLLGAHRLELKQRASEISTLTKSLSSREKDVALLRDKAKRVKAAAAAQAKQRAAERQALATLTKSLSSREKDVALLKGKVEGLKAAAAEAQANLGARDSAHRLELKQKVGEIVTLTKSLSSREKDVALLKGKVEGLKATAAEARTRSIALKTKLEEALTTHKKEREAASATHQKEFEAASATHQKEFEAASATHQKELEAASATHQKEREAAGAKHQKELEAADATHQKELEAAGAAHDATRRALTEHAALIEEIDGYLTGSAIGQVATLASSRLKQLGMRAQALAARNQGRGLEPGALVSAMPPPAKRKGRDGTTLTDAFERLANHRLAIDHFISLGAGSGGDSIAIRDRYYPNASLLMIEAQADHEPALTEIRHRSGGETRYVICAATREDGTVQFQSSSRTGGAVASGKADGTITVPARSVDSLAREYGLDGTCFLKFDTHGVEVNILEGATETLEHTSLIMMEVYNFKLNFVDRRNLTFDEMCGYLRERGFRCVDICDPLFRPNDRALWQAHLFFIRDDHPVFNSNSYSAPPPFGP